ncbi:Fic family protein [Tissierella pigra]|uniref:Fic family protein n=1 Tax=Tissierella pigra TaxID=2607614 RepID=UPI0018A6AF30|nr:Fic family protein [Tissierella pigra]MBU5426985.1 Fic family protein [Tissierella pigra]
MKFVVEFAALLHKKFVFIHPFKDGNDGDNLIQGYYYNPNFLINLGNIKEIIDETNKKSF